jgi:hypothetical protein
MGKAFGTVSHTENMYWYGWMGGVVCLQPGNTMCCGGGVLLNYRHIFTSLMHEYKVSDKRWLEAIRLLRP